LKTAYILGHPKKKTRRRLKQLGLDFDRIEPQLAPIVRIEDVLASDINTSMPTINQQEEPDVLPG
jgi:hypothetical protein